MPNYFLNCPALFFPLLPPHHLKITRLNGISGLLDTPLLPIVKKPTDDVDKK